MEKFSRDILYVYYKICDRNKSHLVRPFLLEKPWSKGQTPNVQEIRTSSSYRGLGVGSHVGRRWLGTRKGPSSVNPERPVKHKVNDRLEKGFNQGGDLLKRVGPVNIVSIKDRV